MNYRRSYVLHLIRSPFLLLALFMLVLASSFALAGMAVARQLHPVQQAWQQAAALGRYGFRGELTTL